MNLGGMPSNGLAELQGRLIILKIGVLIIVSLLVLRLWQLQVRDGPHYRELSQDNRTRSILLHPARGLVYDRKGRLLANNIPSFNLYVELKDIKNREMLAERLVHFLDLDASDLQKQLRSRGGFTRVKLMGGLTLQQAAIVESHRLDLPGVVIQPEYQRNNPQGGFAAHLIGYVGEVSEEQLNQEEFSELVPGSIVGQYGVERMYDRILRGQAGRKLIEVDALGHEKQTLSVEKPQAGHDLYLTIDFQLQKLAEDLLGEEAGAIVALTPHSGAILALASQPSFDPNVLSRSLSSKDWNNILKDTRHPLTNRAIQGLYPPGSTFKIIMAAGALATETLEASDTVRCLGGFPFGNRTYRDWKAGGHGTVDLHEAIVNSCDVYFYKVGNKMGIDAIAAYASLFGLGRKTGVDLPSESTGIVPTPEWKERARGEPWYPGETISASIGQGYVTVTPIQMANVIATIANGGITHRPQLVRGVRRRDTGVVQEEVERAGMPLNLRPDLIRTIQRSLEAVVTEGTARRAQSKMVSIAGKTGTSQVVALREESEEETPKEFRDHAWFVSYAPTEQPTIAVAVLVEHMGHGGSAAAPLAKKLIEAFITMEALDQPQVGPSSSEISGQPPAIRETSNG